MSNAVCTDLPTPTTSENSTKSGAAIYVGTYQKYNNGSIAGDWIELEGLTKDGFYAACAELHKDEPDAELMFQDWENTPEGMVSETSVKDTLWDWLELDAEDRKLLEVYLEGVDADGTIEKAREAFAGTYTGEEDWAATFLEETGGLEGVPKPLRNYIDFKAYGRDARLGGEMTFVERGFEEVWAFHKT